MKIIELTAAETQRLCADLNDGIGPHAPYRTLKVHIDSDGFKYKIGEGVWTPSLGHDLAGTTRAVDPDPLAKLKYLVAEIELDENMAEQRLSDLNLAAEKSCDYTHYDELHADENEKSADRLHALLRAIHEHLGD